MSDNTGNTNTSGDVNTTGDNNATGNTGTSSDTVTNPQDQATTPTNSPSRPLRQGLYAPPLGGNNDVPDDMGESLYAIAAKIMSPPTHLYSDDGNSVTLTKTWAVGIIGTSHFEPQPFFPIWVLYHSGDLRLNGVNYGLSKEMHDWLCSPTDTITLPAAHFIKEEESST